MKDNTVTHLQNEHGSMINEVHRDNLWPWAFVVGLALGSLITWSALMAWGK